MLFLAFKLSRFNIPTSSVETSRDLFSTRLCGRDSCLISAIHLVQHILDTDYSNSVMTSRVTQSIEILLAVANHCGQCVFYTILIQSLLVLNDFAVLEVIALLS